MQSPVIKDIPNLLLTGISMEMSLSNDQTPTLWGKFRRQQKQHFAADPDFFFSVTVYPSLYFENFNPTTLFTKHALVKPEYAGEMDLGWERFSLPGGLFAVFSHKGPDSSIFQYIYTQWLPQSGYVLDNRPHFEKLPSGYIPGHPDSEEEIYIPIRAV
jgi:AraC family transcriptional regulator